MRLFKFKNRTETEKLEKFLNDIEKHCLVVKTKSKSEDGDVLSIETYKAIKLSSLNEIAKKHFGITLKQSENFTVRT